MNEFVDSLREADRRGWVPYLAPLHGGVGSRVLSVLGNPGAMTQNVSGSAFVSIENADPTSERQCELFAKVEISALDVTPWHAYPWYINRRLITSDLDAGGAVLRDLLTMLPNLRVVLLQGDHARSAWERVLKHRSTPPSVRRLEVARSIDPSPGALPTADPVERARQIEQQVIAFERVSEILAAHSE
ncbi:uracil-DNA glycosylase [Rhodococcus sp. NPDC006774]|uniref:uracil-DNA glycosylase n=1 Tax=Rhodococcus sp. NPDC006774 TaxID=3157186 RepID=UPI0033EA0FD5